MAYSATEDAEPELIEPKIKPTIKSGRKLLPKALKRVVVEHDLSNHEKFATAAVKKHTLAMR